MAPVRRSTIATPHCNCSRLATIGTPVRVGLALERPTNANPA